MGEPLPVLLPPCGARQAAFVLSPRQRRELVKILATEGKEGMERWLREEERKDPHIRRRVQEERARLEREARLQERRINEQYGSEKAARESDWETRMRDLGMREAGLRDRLEKARAGPTLSMEDLVRASPLFAAAKGSEGRRTPWRWLKDMVLRFWYWLVRLWVRFVRGTRTAFGRPPDRARTVLTLPDGLELDLRGLTSLNPRFVAQVRLKMREGKNMRERMRQMWDRLLGREDYAETAARLMQNELATRHQQRALEVETEAAELEAHLKALEREARQAARDREGELQELDQKREEDLEQLAAHLKRGAYETMREEVLDELAEAGLVSTQGDPTEALLERFSGLLLDEARRTLPAGGQTTPGTYAGGEGEYHKAPLQSLNERGALELVDSLLRARLSHPHVRHLYDQDLVVHREVRSAKTHVVVIFDQSGSMEEKGRLDAAKTVCLTMYRAVKDADPMNRVDILAMSTGVEHVDLAGLWNAEPKGFTNHGAALREARILLEMEGADRRLVYLITDGLPEAMTVRGVDTADRPEVCMPYALNEAKSLAQVEGVRLFVIQLETEDPMYVDAAKRIAQAAGGTMEAVEPQALLRTMLVDLDTVQQSPERVLPTPA